MSAEQNKQLVRRLVHEAIARRNPDVLDELAAGDFARAAERWVQPFQSAFPDFEIEIIDLIAEDNLTRMRQLGIEPATGSTTSP